MTISGLGFAGMLALVKIARDSVPPMPLVFFRGVVCWGICAVLWKLAQKTTGAIPEKLEKRAQRTLVVRSLAGFTGVVCLTHALLELPLALASLLNWMAPIFTVIFAWIRLGERMQAKEWMGFGLGILGIALLSSEAWRSEHLSVYGLALGVLGAAAGGLASTSIRELSTSISPLEIVRSFMAWTTGLSFPWWVLWMRDHGMRDLDLRLVWVFLGVGVLGTIGQLAMTLAYRLAPAGIVSSMSLQNAVASGWIGWVFLGEVLGPLEFFSMAIIMAGVVVVAWSPTRGARQQERKKS
jgi:drug/metabolite transporter (DMT)-like permease